VADGGPAGRSLPHRCQAIELLIADVDGVLTDGGIVLDADGRELKRFHVRDGFALRVWNDLGKRSALISGRSAPVVESRARELHIGRVVQGAAEKLSVFRSVLHEEQLSPEAVCYVGDDLPDLPPLRAAGLGVAVADACAELRAAADYVTRVPGGSGAVREVIEMILRCQGHWDAVMHRLETSAGEQAPRSC
jgi:3-deoxy-D-manno-octulosonate 8-phosphate phosphatase (KDO 8-P phosphatase)